VVWAWAAASRSSSSGAASPSSSGKRALGRKVDVALVVGVC